MPNQMHKEIALAAAGEWIACEKPLAMNAAEGEAMVAAVAPDVPQGGAALYRLDVHAAGSGVTGDLLAHDIDTAMWLNGPITRLRTGGGVPPWSLF